MAPIGSCAGVTGAMKTQRNGFNTAWSASCVSPPAGVKCVDLATVLNDPGATDNLLAAYDNGSCLLSAAGISAVAATWQAVYP